MYAKRHKASPSHAIVMPGAPVWQSRRGFGHGQEASNMSSNPRFWSRVQNVDRTLIQAKLRLRPPPSTPTHSSYENEQ